MSLFAIGDIHGFHDLLMKALAAVEESSHSPNTIVFLGDYIDRGPDSAKVVETLMVGPKREGDSWICLMGNHEQMMVEAHEGGLSERRFWIDNGGDKALASWNNKVPAKVLDWCRNRPIHHETASHYFVHAGIMPGVPLEDQSDQVRLWIRDRFLDDESDHGKHIVHGHTPFDEPQRLQNRTNLDSGSFFNHQLAIGRFDAPGPATQVFMVHQ
jgi:serine/threonine protein phosphatase 1